MAKPRILADSFWDDPQVAELKRDARLLLAGMITTCADDEGRMLADAGYLRKKVFGFDEDVTRSMVEDWRNQILISLPNVKLYTVNGQDYIWLSNFKEYQQIRYVVSSKLPPFSADYAQKQDFAEKSGKLPKITENSPRVGLGRDDVGESREGKGSAEYMAAAQAPTAPSDFDIWFAEFWRLYPKKIRKQSAETRARAIAIKDRPLVLVAIENYVQSDKVKQGYVKEAPGFLTDGYWKDYVNGPIQEGIRNGQSTTSNNGQQRGRYPTKLEQIEEGIRGNIRFAQDIISAEGNF